MFQQHTWRVEVKYGHNSRYQYQISCRITVRRLNLSSILHRKVGIFIRSPTWNVQGISGTECCLIKSFCIHPRYQGSWGQHGAHLGPVGPRCAPCWPHEPCYQGPFLPCFVCTISIISIINTVPKKGWRLSHTLHVVNDYWRFSRAIDRLEKNIHDQAIHCDTITVILFRCSIWGMGVNLSNFVWHEQNRDHFAHNIFNAILLIEGVNISFEIARKCVPER